MEHELTDRICQELRRHQKLFFTGSESTSSGNRLQNAPLNDLIDNILFYDEYERSTSLLAKDSSAKAYLKSKNLNSYGDLLEMHGRIVRHLSNMDPNWRAQLAQKMNWGDDQPEFKGPGRIYLGIFDFLVAIPHIPHSSNPEQPTISGLLLSSIQPLLRDEFFYYSKSSHHDCLHMLLTHSVLLSGYARTTTGAPLCDAYQSHWPEADVKYQSGNFLFDDFNVTNVIPFHPEQVLLTVRPRRDDSPRNPAPEVKVVYNIFESGQATYISSPAPSGQEQGLENTAPAFSRYSPDFMRTMRSIIS